MKLILVSAILLFYHNHCVNSYAIIDVISDKMNQFSHSIKVAFKSFRVKMKDFFFPDMINKKETDLPLTNYRKSRTNKAFSDFVDEMAAESETESPEYLTLKSDPTALMSTPQLATLHGKRIESHIVLTKDGYFLTLHRLISPCRRDGDKSYCNNETVLLHHGLLGSSADWILLGSDDSLPYILSNLGYDVWMANARGNYYSRGHTSKQVDSTDFWKFSWHEMGYYDLPAVIEYMKTVKNTSSKINYIGYSMGASAFLVLLSSLPQYSSSFKLAIFLAPLAFLSNTEGPLRILRAMAFNPPMHLLKLLGNGEFIPKRKVPHWISNKYCQGPELFCCNPLFFFAGAIPSDTEYLDRSFLARLMYHVPAGGSTNTVLHYAQLIKTGKFHKFNYETEEYPLSQISVPIALISSTDDTLATVADVLRLYFSIQKPIDHYVIHDKNLNHTDFIWGHNAAELVFGKVVDFLTTGLYFNTTRINEV
ncbi:unnamed protein product [Pieris macdunnoughi]|uniref:Partial AB-hydrolase lipase domain-containing protein n=1 Tax=Pieris macdunnoughi TaxID=345717 RepID=A0A821L3C1_9NEOP|nr:unnamed protein product [Pieris macdunnoughi]